MEDFVEAKWKCKTTKRFCDEACLFQHCREKRKNAIEHQIEDAKTWLQYSHSVARRYGATRLLFYRSCLARKPRDELERLHYEIKKSIVELIEYGREKQLDGLVFEAGEAFKQNFDEFFDAWSAPTTADV